MSENTSLEAVKENLPMSVELMDELASDAGTGFEGVTSADISIPYYGVLQAMSPQVKRGPRQIIGAKEGDIYNTVTQEVVEADVGIAVIPCVFQKAFVEWTPRDSGGGFVKQHMDESILSQTVKDAKNNNVLPNGNHIVQTAYHYVIRIREDASLERALISMTSTQLKASRRWLALQMALQLEINGKMINPPPYSHCYRLTTGLQQKDEYVWSVWNIGAASLIRNADVYRIAKKFAQDISAGLVKVSAPDFDQETNAQNTVDHEVF